MLWDATKGEKKVKLFELNLFVRLTKAVDQLYHGLLLEGQIGGLTL